MHEALLDGGHRHRHGVHYTPRPDADGVIVEAVRGWDHPDAPLVRHPAVGSGAFLLAAARWFANRGPDRRRIVADLLWGVDRDPLAVEVPEASLWLWPAEDGDPARCGPLVVGDALVTLGHAWPDRPDAGFDLVVGNPPFGSQLSTATSPRPEDTERLRVALGQGVHGHADTATVFLLAGMALTRPGGRVSMLAPESFLAARDAGPARRAALAEADLVSLWVADEPVFPGTPVRVCAPVLHRRPRAELSRAEAEAGAGARVRVRVTTGPSVTIAGEWPFDARTPTWAPLTASARGVPDVSDWHTAGTLSDRSHATAGFRDQYYGLVPHVLEAAELPRGEAATPLVTSGLVDPLTSHWGRRPARFAKRRWSDPAVDLDALATSDPALARWVAERRVPKVVVAAQTRVVEAWVDAEGSAVPSVPLIAVTPRASDPDLWCVAAVLLAPPVTAWALTHHGGAGLAADTVKLSARQVLDVPLPADRDAWARSADCLRTVAAAPESERGRLLGQVGADLCCAYGLARDHPVVAWWRARLDVPSETGGRHPTVTRSVDRRDEPKR